MSRPFILPGLLVGGLVPGPWLETGDRIGDGDRFMADAEREVRPTMCILSRDDMEGRWWPMCSAWTTSANEMKERRLTSAESREP